MIRRNWIVALTTVPLLLLSCAYDRLTGNGSQTGNPMIAGVVYENDGATPAAGAYVFLRKKNPIADIPGFLQAGYADSAAARTGADGRFAIDSVDTGVYVVECSDGGNGFAFVDSVAMHYFDSTFFLPPLTLKPAGAIKGLIRLSEGGDPRKVFVLVPDADRFTIADSSGAFTVRRLPEGGYTVRIVPTLDAYDVFDTPGVAVVSAETTDVGVVDLPYRGIPTPKDVTVSYDTLKQQVTLRWGEAAGRAGMTYNVHRRDIDPTTALFTQLNIFPVPDTFYVDSLCERNKTYEYRVTAADSNATEGMKSAGVRVRIALFPLVPKNVAIAYDTARQTIRVHWGNPDAAIVTGFNVYRRNIDLGESFWTPFNKGPILDTCLVDSTYNLCPNCDPACDDASPPQPPTYEYCVGAIIKNLREGARSDSVRARICLDNVRPKNVRISYDTVGHAVRLRWRRPETALVTRFNVYKRNCGGEERFLSQINKEPIGDTLFTDTACTRNQRYEYCVASLVEKNRSEAKSEVIGVLITAPFIAADDPAAAQ